MDDVVRGGRLLLIGLAGRLGLVGLLGAGCAAAAPSEAVGASRSAPAAGTPAARPAAAGGAAALLADYRASFVKETRTRFVSQGHAGGRYEADVFVSPDMKGAWMSPKSPAPVGARVIEEHFERGTSKPGPTYMMEKREPGFDAARGDWRYLVVGPAGDTVKDGPIDACATCHAEAPADHLFRFGE